MNPDDTSKIQDVTNKSNTINQFALSATPLHIHNGLDTPNISFQNIINRNEIFTIIIPGTSAADPANYGVFFTAPYKCSFVGATEVHATAGTDTLSVTVQVEKLTGIQASGSGVVLLSAGFDLKGAINTVQTATLAKITNANFIMAKGDRLGLARFGTLTSVAHVNIVIKLNY